MSLEKILVVDDDEDILNLTKMSLESVGGFQVASCLSGQEALGALDEFKPDLVLLDYMMPGMDGAQTLVEIQNIETFKTLPVIFLTAKVQNHEIEEYKKSGVVGVISKPYDPITLSSEVQNIWDQHSISA